MKLNLFIILFTIQLNLLLAQASEIAFENYGTSDGLASTWGVSPIVQDQNGYLWLLSIQGLNRFDGYEFKVYNHDKDDSSSLISNSIYDLFVDSKSRLWILSALDEQRVLSFYDPDKDNFKHTLNFKDLHGQKISFEYMASPQEDKNGMFWFITDEGIKCLDPETKIIKEDSHLKKLNNFLQTRRLDFFIIDSNQNFWIVIKDELIKFNPVLDSIDTFKYIQRESDSTTIVDIFEDYGGYLLIGSRDNSMNLYDPSVNSLLKLPTKSGQYKLVQPPKSKREEFGATGIISIINRISSGELWIGTVNGGIKIFNKNLTRFSSIVENQISSSENSLGIITGLFEDNQQNVWITTFNKGILKVIPSKSRFTLSGNGLSSLKEAESYSIRAIYQSKDRTLWIGTSEGVFFEYNSTSNQTKIFESNSDVNSQSNNFSGSDIQSFYEDPDGSIWIASFNGIIKYNRNNGVFKRAQFEIDGKILESTQDIESIIGSDDIIWIGTWGDGIFQFNRITRKTINYGRNSGLLSNRLWTMIQTREGDICAGTTNGLSILNKSDQKFQNYLIGTAVNTIYEDDDLDLWLGTRQGLYKLSPKKEILKHYTVDDGLPSNMIGGILSDDENYLWIGTGNGLVKFNPQDESILTFDEEDGVLIDLYETANSFCKTQDGLLLFGSSTGTGITAFNPNNIDYNTHPPSVLITDLNVFNNATDTTVTIKIDKRTAADRIELDHTQNDIVFNYVGIHFKDPKKNNYKYKFDPYDSDWKDAGTLRSVRYTSLDPGSYSFRVIASNSDGIWNKEGASLSIIIHPPLWETWWAYTLYVIFIIGFLFSVRKFELKRRGLKEKQKLLETENKRKTEELEEARQLQLSMLPKELPQLPNLDIAVYMQTATEVGGDYYDFHVAIDGSLTVVLGDATGHGMKAGTMVTTIKGLFSTHADNSDILSTFQEFTRCIKRMHFEKLSMCLTMLKFIDQEVVMSSAGMPPIFILRKDAAKVDEFQFEGMPLGTMNNFPYEIRSTKLNAGDIILLTSDGLPELLNDHGVMYGYERIMKKFETMGSYSPDQIISQFKKEGSEWVANKEPDDDVTFVVIKVK